MPQFRNMTRLHAKFYVCDLEMLPCVLESCPNLKSLVLVNDFALKTTCFIVTVIKDVYSTVWDN